MYLSGLGFSLKPPKWVRDLGAQVLSATKISVPTPAGIPVVIDLSKPGELERLRSTITGTRISVGQAAPSAFDRLTAGIGDAPSWGTLAIVGAAGAALWFILGRRSSRYRRSRGF